MDKEDFVKVVKRVRNYKEDENASYDWNKSWKEACNQILYELDKLTEKKR